MSERMILRPLMAKDARVVQRLARSHKVAYMTHCRIWSYHMVRNPASGRVLAKAGMKREGLLRQHVRKNEVFEDVETWGLLRGDWDRTSNIQHPTSNPEPRTSNLER